MAHSHLRFTGRVLSKSGFDPAAQLTDGGELTPLQQVNNILLKRDDLFEIAGVRGGKPRHSLRTVRPMFVYEVMSRRPISTNILARTGSRKRSEIRAATWLPIEMPGREPSSRAPTMYQSTLPMSQWPRPATRVRGTA